jgi:transcriptional regulator with XRE-family HTH domain
VRKGDDAATAPIPTSGPISPRDLRLFRIAAGLTLEQAALGAEISAPYLSMLETRRKPLTPEITIRLLRMYFPEGAYL